MSDSTIAGLAYQFLTKLTEDLETGFSRADGGISELEIYLADLSPLDLRPSSDVTCVVIRQKDVEVYGKTTLAEIVMQEVSLRQRAPATTLILSEIDPSFLDFMSRDPYWSLIVRPPEMREMISVLRPRVWLRSFFRKNLQLRFLSPFEYKAPVSGSQFVGRTWEMNFIQEHTEKSISIEGGRRIGKTSLIMQTRSKIEKLTPAEQRVRLIYEPLFGFSGNYDAFLLNIIRKFNEVPSPKLYRGSLLDYFPRFVKLMERRYGKITFFIDEIDDLIEYEQHNGYKLLSTFKTIADEKSARFIVAGFRLLTSERLSYRSPIQSFEPIDLGTLSKGDAEELLVNPLRAMGITMESGVFSDVLKFSGGHPQIIQLFGQSIVDFLDRDHKMVVDHKCLAEIKRSGKIYDTLYDIVIVNSTDLEFALIGSLAEHEEFNQQDINRILEQHGINLSVSKIHQVLKDLIQIGIIRRAGQDADAYQFIIPLQPLLVKRRAATLELAWRKAVEGFSMVNE